MNKKMIFAVAVCIMSAVLILTGCGGNNGKQSDLNLDKTEYSDLNGLKLPISEKGETIEVMTSGAVDKLDEKLFAQAIRELTGIELKYTIVASGNYGNKLKMLLSSKQLPDMFDSTLTRSELEMLAKNKAIVNFTEYKDELPNIKKLYLDNKENLELASNYVVDGNLYVVPGYNIARNINHGFMYRKDIFEKNGIKPWTNTEEFYQVLKKLKEIYPSSTPLASKIQGGLIGRFAAGWGLSSDMGITKYMNDGDYIYSGTHEEMKNVLDFMHKLYSEGLLDPEFLTCTEASWSSKMTQDDKAFVTFDWIDRMDMFNDQIKEINPDYNMTFGYPIGSYGKYERLSKVGGANLTASNTDKGKIAAKLIDFLVSPAGAKLSTLGVKGVSYDEVDGKVQYKLPQGINSNIKSLEEEFGLFTQSIALRFDPTCVYYQFTPQVENAQKLVVDNNLCAEKSNAPIIVKSEYNEEYGSILAELQTKFLEFASKYIVGETTECDKMWSDWLAQADSLGVQRIVEIANMPKK